MVESMLLDQEPTCQSFLDDVLLGLQGSPKSLPCKYFYDKRGSSLFDQICELEEYYLTRTELEIMVGVLRADQFVCGKVERLCPGGHLAEGPRVYRRQQRHSIERSSEFVRPGFDRRLGR